MSFTWTHEASVTDGEDNGGGAKMAWSPELQVMVAIGTVNNITDDDASFRLLVYRDGSWSSFGNVLSPDDPDLSFAYDVTWSGALGKFFLVGSGADDVGQIAVSTDGETWEVHQPFSDATFMTAITWSNEAESFMGTCHLNPGGPLICSSLNGLTWTKHATPWDAGSFPTVHDFAYHDGRWVAAGYGGGGGLGTSSVLTSDNSGLTWTARSTPFNSDQTIAIIWSHTWNKFFATGSDLSNVNCIISSGDGISWDVVADQLGGDNAVGQILDMGPLGLLCVGQSTITDDDMHVEVSVDGGLSWTIETTPLDHGLLIHNACLAPEIGKVFISGQGPDPDLIGFASAE